MNEGEVSSFVTPELVEGTPLLTLVTPFDDIERNLCLLSVLSYYIPGAEGGGGEVLNKVLYGEAPPRGPTPYHFIYYFGRKGTSFIYLLVKKATPFRYLF